MEGVFTISLDFELHWGVFDKYDRIKRKHIYQNTIKVIPQMLNLFAQYDVHVTWATVGGLFAKNKNEWKAYAAETKPNYLNEKFSVYKWVSEHTLEEEYSWAHFSPWAIENILQYPGQEIGTHTFSHYYVLEKKMGDHSFGSDLEAAKKAAAKFNITLKSLVFPRNQYNEEALKICAKHDIQVVRTNLDNWFLKPARYTGTRYLKKAFRIGNVYMPVGYRLSYPITKIKKEEGKPIELPAGRFFERWRPGSNLKNKLRLRRMIQELRSAAKHKECYHLWWHPENFGEHPDENLQMLEVLLKKYKTFKEKYSMQSWNMGEYAKHLDAIKH